MKRKSELTDPRADRLKRRNQLKLYDSLPLSAFIKYACPLDTRSLYTCLIQASNLNDICFFNKYAPRDVLLDLDVSQVKRFTYDKYTLLRIYQAMHMFDISGLMRKIQSEVPEMIKCADAFDICEITRLSSKNDSVDDIIFYLGLLEADQLDLAVPRVLKKLCKRTMAFFFSSITSIFACTTDKGCRLTIDDLLQIFSKLKDFGFNPSGCDIACCLHLLASSTEWYAIIRAFSQVWSVASLDADPIYMRYLSHQKRHIVVLSDYKPSRSMVPIILLTMFGHQGTDCIQQMRRFVQIVLRYYPDFLQIFRLYIIIVRHFDAFPAGKYRYGWYTRNWHRLAKQFLIYVLPTEYQDYSSRVTLDDIVFHRGPTYHPDIKCFVTMMRSYLSRYYSNWRLNMDDLISFLEAILYDLYD